MRPVTVLFWAIILYHGLRRAKTLYLIPVQRQSTGPLLMLSRRQVGRVIFYLRYMFHFAVPLWFIVIMFLLSIFRKTPYNTNGPNMSRLIFISFAGRCPSVTSVFYTSLPPISMPTSSPRVSLVSFLKVFAPV